MTANVRKIGNLLVFVAGATILGPLMLLGAGTVAISAIQIVVAGWREDIASWHRGIGDFFSDAWGPSQLAHSLQRPLDYLFGGPYSPPTGSFGRYLCFFVGWVVASGGFIALRWLWERQRGRQD